MWTNNFFLLFCITCLCSLCLEFFSVLHVLSRLQGAVTLWYWEKLTQSSQFQTFYFFETTLCDKISGNITRMKNSSNLLTMSLKKWGSLSILSTWRPLGLHIPKSQNVALTGMKIKLPLNLCIVFMISTQLWGTVWGILDVILDAVLCTDFTQTGVFFAMRAFYFKQTNSMAVTLHNTIWWSTHAGRGAVVESLNHRGPSSGFDDAASSDPGSPPWPLTHSFFPIRLLHWWCLSIPLLFL